MNDTPVADGDMSTDLDSAIELLRTDDPAAAADRAEAIAHRLTVELDPPSDEDREPATTPPGG